MSLHSLRRRLDRVQSMLPSPATAYPPIVCVDAHNRILDDGSAACRPWVGRDRAELPRRVQVLRGVAPVEILGRLPLPPTPEEP